MPTETRWPTYARRAEKAGILSSLSVPLPIQTDLIGALNVYSERTAAFRPAGRNLAERLASFVAVACANAEAYSTAVEFGAQMQAAMATRAVIEQAKGIFMAENRCSPEAAFEILRSRSMAVDVKLRDVAQQVVACVYGVEAPGLP